MFLFYKIVSCKSDNRISLLFSSTGYGWNILWENTKDFSSRTNICSRREVAGGCRKIKPGLNNCQKKDFPASRVTLILPMRFFANKVFFFDRLSDDRLYSNSLLANEITRWRLHIFWPICAGRRQRNERWQRLSFSSSYGGFRGCRVQRRAKFQFRETILTFW